MVGKTGSGRRPGFKHSNDTKLRIAEGMKAKQYNPTSDHRDNISRTKLMYGLDEKCIQRLEDLKANYPEEEDFFLDNEEELLVAMRSVRTEKELSDIRRYVETATLRANEPYQYASTSCYAAEDAVIALLDFKRLLQKLPLVPLHFN